MGGLSAEDRELLTQSVAAFVQNTCDYETLRRTLAGPSGRRADWWRRLAQELGVLGIAQGEAVGGVGGEVADLAIVAEACGRHLVNEPLLQSVAIAGELLRDGGPTADALLSEVIEGEAIVAPALLERGSRYRPDAIETDARADGEGWRLSGRKTMVRAAPWADALIVSALTPQGISLFLVDVTAPGLELVAYPTFDGQQAADVILSGVVVETDRLIGEPGRGLEIIERALDVGVLIQSAEALGVMRHMMDATLEYVRTRRQFGQPIGAFQALQHRLADMAMALARAEAVTRSGLKLFEAAPDRARLVSGIKLAVDAACEAVGEGAVQLHGAIGLTEELSVSHAFKRLTLIQTELGDAAFHQERILDRAAA